MLITNNNLRSKENHYWIIDNAIVVLNFGAQCQIRTGTLIASDSKSDVSANSTNWANFCILHYNLILSRVLCKIFVKSVFFSKIKDRRKIHCYRKITMDLKLVPDARFELARP